MPGMRSYPYHTMNLPRGKDALILALVFLLVFLSSSLFFLVDESPLEPMLPWTIAVFAYVGLGLSLVVNMPLISMVHLVNIAGNAEVIPYDAYFAVLPFVTAIFWTGLLAAMSAIFPKQRNRETRAS